MRHPRTTLLVTFVYITTLFKTFHVRYCVIFVVLSFQRTDSVSVCVVMVSIVLA